MKETIPVQKILIAVLIILVTGSLLTWLLLSRNRGELLAEVVIQGETVMKIPLNHNENSVIWDLQDKYHVPVHLETDHGRIRFVDVDCPDHICENTGWLSLEYQSAVCMPNRTVVTVYPQK
jgi:hypothetical protein